MTENEPRTKVNVYRERTIQVRDYEPVKVSASITQGFESFVDAKTIQDWMTLMERVVEDSLNRQEAAEKNRRNTYPPEPSIRSQLPEKPIIKPVPDAVKKTMVPAKLPFQAEDEWDDCPKCSGRKKKKFPTCAQCR
jgi:hypothetical protein